MQQAGYIGVWSVDDDGAVPPRFTVGGPKGILRKPRGLDLDPLHNAVIVSDKELNAVLTYEMPQIFNPTRRRASVSVSGVPSPAIWFGQAVRPHR